MLSKSTMGRRNDEKPGFLRENGTLSRTALTKGRAGWMPNRGGGFEELRFQDLFWTRVMKYELRISSKGSGVRFQKVSVD